ncbi:MAG TPA: ABC transporter ATP-binding protein [Geminocystis sp. M7585_C2015_104]|nr:ABC transporter ATP-binding protein [Geminocystis sp. M7585_C2015_104]
MVNRMKDNDWGLLLKLVPYAKQNYGILLTALLLLVPLSLAGAIQPLLVGQAISLLREEPTWWFLNPNNLSQSINLLAFILLATIIIRTILLSWQGFLVQKLGQEITASLRQDLFNHVTSLSSSFFQQTPVGKLVTRITNDVEALGDVFATGAIGILSDIFSIIAIIITIFALQWQLACLLVFLLIPVTGLILYFQREYRKANYAAREELSLLNSLLQENVVGISVVQMFRREKYNSELFRQVNQRYREAIDKTIFHDSAVSATLEWVSLVAIAIVLWLGGYLILKGQLNFGVLSAFILYAQRLFEPLRQFAEKFTMFQSGFTAIERVSELMSVPIEIQDRPANKTVAPRVEGKIGEIRFEDVWFAYKPGEYVLKGLNFTINPGEKVALVGPTGAGKSSIIRLLCRLYEPQRGRILVDGIDIKDIPQAELRRHIGVILQESFIFAGDVKRNITLGEDYTDEEVVAAAKATNIHDFIMQLPQGYDTLLRERGANLSAGQKQLLAFARVAIRNPNILVLDEATANLDVATEAVTQAALERILVNKTAIIIAHRLATIRNVDRIFVLKQGQLVESGGHEELLAQNGVYASLYKLQMLTIPA